MKTFNRIAQGFATGLASERLKSLGFRQSLVKIGEYRGQGGARTLGLPCLPGNLVNPEHIIHRFMELLL